MTTYGVHKSGVDKMCGEFVSRHPHFAILFRAGLNYRYKMSNGGKENKWWEFCSIEDETGLILVSLNVSEIGEMVYSQIEPKFTRSLQPATTEQELLTKLHDTVLSAMVFRYKLNLFHDAIRS